MRRNSTFSLEYNEYVSTPHLQFLLPSGDLEGSWPKIKAAEQKEEKTDAVFVLN